jgi:hypothetical protein
VALNILMSETERERVGGKREDAKQREEEEEGERKRERVVKL